MDFECELRWQKRGGKRGSQGGGQFKSFYQACKTLHRWALFAF